MPTPKLRFKEFDGDWTSKQLGKIIGISSASRVFKEQWQDSGVPFFRTSDVVSIFKNKENEKAYISLELFEELAKKSGKIKQGDLLVTGGGSIGIPYLVANDQPLYFKDADLLWMKSSGIVEGPFLYNFFISPKFREYLKSISHTGTISHFTIEQAKATPFGFPSKEEQTKIASFLSQVDEKISQLTQKYELLSQYKQGMMQKLFSQQLRFKADDGSEFGEWEEVRLGNLVDLTSGFAFKSDFFSEDGNKLITPKNFTTTGKANFTDTNTKWTTEISDKKYICRPNDLLVLLTDLTQSCELLGKPILLSQDDGNVLLNQRIVKIIPNRKLEKPFLLYLLLTDDFHELIASTASGTTVKHSSNKVLQSFHFYLPCLEEQTKIANFLSAIDQKIEVVAHQIEQAKTWKKGLLQQMFV
ncbi:restriction endonuclease subunit S [Acinetobacter sp. YH01005]|uniref:restriction endonuclease subunit S n=1 Tax=Acinetobacter sp. YH01005 TaxID=2601021 RepID=UPI0015D35DEB|nr:restriction endonuclease subunit S [Acinetobacter sp. YH01005]